MSRKRYTKAKLDELRSRRNAGIRTLNDLLEITKSQQLTSSKKKQDLSVFYFGDSVLFRHPKKLKTRGMARYAPVQRYQEFHKELMSLVRVAFPVCKPVPANRALPEVSDNPKIKGHQVVIVDEAAFGSWELLVAIIKHLIFKQPQVANRIFFLRAEGMRVSYPKVAGVRVTRIPVTLANFPKTLVKHILQVLEPEHEVESPLELLSDMIV